MASAHSGVAGSKITSGPFAGQTAASESSQPAGKNWASMPITAASAPNVMPSFDGPFHDLAVFVLVILSLLDLLLFLITLYQHCVLYFRFSVDCIEDTVVSLSSTRRRRQKRRKRWKYNHSSAASSLIFVLASFLIALRSSSTVFDTTIFRILQLSFASFLMQEQAATATSFRLVQPENPLLTIPSRTKRTAAQQLEMFREPLLQIRAAIRLRHRL
jgi:hypothetical protein